MSIKRSGAQTTSNKSASSASAQPSNVASYVASASAGGLGTSISSVYVTNSSYVQQTPATSYISTSGNYVSIIGTGFTSNSLLYVQGNLVTATTYVSSTRINAQIPAYSTSSVTTQQLLIVNTATNNAGILVTGFGYGVAPYWTTNSSLNGSTPNVSVSLSALSDSTMTYAILSGTVPTGLSLNTSTGVLSGTISTGTSTSFVVQAVNVQNQSNTQTFTITIASADPYFYETTLLLNGETSTSTYITDASTSSLALTVNGTVSPNRLSPLWSSGYYSNYFPVSSLQLAYNGTPLFAQGTAYTIEAWVMLPPGSTANTYAGAQPIACTASSSSSNGNGHYWGFGNTAFVFENRAGTAYPTISYTAPNNQWFHFAFTTADGQNFTLYINGSSVGTYNDTSGAYYADSAYNLYIGAGNGNGSNGNTGSYISNLRYTKAQVYTGNFTVPTTPLTATQSSGTNINAITAGQCTILTCQRANFIDNSILNGAMSVISGTPKVTSNQPFSVLPSSINVNTGYSTYFNGSTDSLTMSDNAAFQMGTGDFTIECWVCPTALSSSDARIWSYQNSGSSTVMNVYLLGSGSSSVFSGEIRGSSGLSDSQQNGTTSAVIGTWYHVAYVRASGNTRLFVNGIQEGSTVTSQTQNLASGVPGIGSYPGFSNYFTGYISNFRILKGTGLYTTNFTPSTTPLTAIANTSLLTCQGSMIADASTNAFVITANGSVKVLNNTYPFTQTTTTVSSVSNFGSGYFDGSTGYLTAPSNAAFAFGTGDFTVEGWYYVTASADQGLWDQRLSSSSTTGFACRLVTSTNYLRLIYNNSTAFTTTQVVPLNQWNHIAIVKSGTTATAYLNGTVMSGGSGTVATPASATDTNMWIGKLQDPSYFYNGYVSNFRVIKGTALYTSNFTLPIAPLTPITNTQLLTLQNKQGANNNTFYDDSTNNFALTRGGTTTQGTFTPFSPTGWSNYFVSTNFLYFANAVFNVSAAATQWTYESWVYVTNDAYFFAIGSGASYGNSFACSYLSGKFGFSQGNGSNALIVNIQSTSTYQSNNWYHYAVSKDASGNIKLFINGTVVANTTNSSTAVASGTTAVICGVYDNNGLGYNGITNGYISYFYCSNLRFVTGAALYTSNFTPPTGPLGIAVSGTTQLLTCQSNRFIDNSSNAFALTISGSPSVQAFSPFAPSVPYSPTTHGGSMYFNGTSDYLTTPSNGAFNFGTGDFTIEQWVYPTSFADNRMFSSLAVGTSSTRSWYLYSAITTGIPNFTWYTDGTTVISLVSSTALTLNTWNHLSVTRNSGTTRMFLNGVQVATASTQNGAMYYNTSAVFTIGREAGFNGSYFVGYISNPRVVNGTALYTSNFTSPTAPPTVVANTSLLLLGTNGGVIDQSSRNDLITVGSATVRNSTFKYGSGSISFNGSSDYLKSPQSLLHDLNGLDFTIEFWVYFNSVSAGQSLVSKYGNSAETAGGQGYLVDWVQSTSNLRLVLGSSAGVTDNIYTWSWSPSINTWYHVAVTRSGTSGKAFINGSQIGTTSTLVTNDIVSSNGLQIGKTHSVAVYLNGYVDDLRITKGYARYTANFTPPISPALTQ